LNEKIVFAACTLLTWTGWIFSFRALILLIRLVVTPVEFERSKLQRGLMIVGVVAAFTFILGAAGMPRIGESTAGAWRLPLTWFVMPFSAWFGVTGIAMGVARLFQAGLSLNPVDKMKLFWAACIWMIVGAVGIFWYRNDPAARIDVLTGGIKLTPATSLAVLLLAVAATVAMVLAARETQRRGVSKAIVAQIALVAGSVVFGVPFVFLLITSFKENQDMSSPNGIVWVPKVSETVPYFDKTQPQFQAFENGQRVIGNVLSHKNGLAELNVLRPGSLAGTVFEVTPGQLTEIPRDAAVVKGTLDGSAFQGTVVEEMTDGHRRVKFTSPSTLAGQTHVFSPADLEAVRKVGLNWKNYPDALEFLPPEADNGLVYLKNTLTLVVLSVVGTILSSSIVAYAFSRMSFPGRNVLFTILLSTMMLPGAVTLLPQFLIFRGLGWVDTLQPMWVPAFFASAFNVFLLRQFFMQIPMELEDAAKIDGCSYFKAFWQIMLPQIKPALAVIAIWTFLGAWNNFMGPLIYISSPEHMPLSYALQLFQGDRGGDEPGMVMAFATMCMAPVLLLFFFAQRYFIEGVTLSGFGGR
jgi:multiple sugar transport system permease protein